MERWAGKVAVVTGASSGLGSILVKELVEHGLKVVGVARRVDLVEKLKEKLKGPGELLPLKCDVRIEKDIIQVFNRTEEIYGTVHILINNAGVSRIGRVLEQDSAFQEEVLSVNVLGVSLCSQYCVKLMKQNGEPCHIINMNSIAGHATQLPQSEPLCAMYCPSKYALTALSDMMSQELEFLNYNIKVTNLSPGNTRSDIGRSAIAAVGTHFQEAMRKSFVGAPLMEPQDVAEAVIYILSAPHRVRVKEMIMVPFKVKENNTKLGWDVVKS